VDVLGRFTPATAAPPGRYHWKCLSHSSLIEGVSRISTEPFLWEIFRLFPYDFRKRKESWYFLMKQFATYTTSWIPETGYQRFWENNVHHIMTSRVRRKKFMDFSEVAAIFLWIDLRRAENIGFIETDMNMESSLRNLENLTIRLYFMSSKDRGHSSFIGNPQSVSYGDWREHFLPNLAESLTRNGIFR